MRPAVPRRRGRERGAALLEVLTVLPLTLAVVLVCVQLVLGAVCAVSAQNAARTGARAATLGQDGRSAALEALGPRLRSRSTASVVRTPGRVVAVVSLRVPRVIPFLPTSLLDLSRRAILPEG